MKFDAKITRTFDDGNLKAFADITDKERLMSGTTTDNNANLVLGSGIIGDYNPALGLIHITHLNILFMCFHISLEILFYDFIRVIEQSLNLSHE